MKMEVFYVVKKHITGDEGSCEYVSGPFAEYWEARDIEEFKNSCAAEPHMVVNQVIAVEPY